MFRTPTSTSRSSARGSGELADEFLSPLPLRDLLEQRPSTARGLRTARRTLLQSSLSPPDPPANIEGRHQPEQQVPLLHADEQPAQAPHADEQAAQSPSDEGQPAQSPRAVAQDEQHFIAPQRTPPPSALSPRVMVVNALAHANAAQSCRLPRFWRFNISNMRTSFYMKLCVQHIITI